MPKELKRLIRAWSHTLVSLTIIVVAVGGSWWGLVPFARRVWKVYQDVGKSQATIDQLENKYAILSALDEIQLRRGSSELLRAIPADKAVTSLMSTIEESARSSGLSLVELTIASPGSLATEAAKRQSQEEKQLGSGIIAASTVVEGSLANIRQLLDSLQRVRRTLRVELAEISLREEAIGRANLTIVAFYAPLPTTLGQLVTPLTPLSPADEDLLRVVSAYPVVFPIQADGVAPAFPSRLDPFSP